VSSVMRAPFAFPLFRTLLYAILYAMKSFVLSLPRHRLSERAARAIGRDGLGGEGQHIPSNPETVSQGGIAVITRKVVRISSMLDFGRFRRYIFHRPHELKAIRWGRDN
jgi:hypothetical protein